MRCRWCRIPTHDTEAVSFPLLNNEPLVIAGAPGSSNVHIFHASCWRAIRALEEKMSAKLAADAQARQEKG